MGFLRPDHGGSSAVGGRVRKRQARFRKVWESERGGQGGGQSGGNHDVGSAFDETRWCGAHAPPAHSPRGRHAASAIRKRRPLLEHRRGFREGGRKVLSQVQVLLSPGRGAAGRPPRSPVGRRGPAFPSKGTISFVLGELGDASRPRCCVLATLGTPPGAPLRAAADRKPRILLTCASRTQMASLSPKPHFKDGRTWMSLDSGLQAAFAVDRLCDPREVAPL